jgi:hypothetical protein
MNEFGATSGQPNKKHIRICNINQNEYADPNYGFSITFSLALSLLRFINATRLSLCVCVCTVFLVPNRLHNVHETSISVRKNLWENPLISLFVLGKNGIEQRAHKQIKFMVNLRLCGAM